MRVNHMNECMKVLETLLEDAEFYMDLIKPTEGEMKICVELTDTGETATLILGDTPEVSEGCVEDADGKVSMKNQVLTNILMQKADAFALAARARMDEKRPVEFEIFKKEHTKEILEVGKALLTYFFAPGRIKIKQLKPELAGQAHGAHPIPLVYWNGLRSSWILVKKGEILNKEGEKDPWPQLFIVLEGRGKGIVGDTESEVEPNMVIYIPKNTIHQLIAEEDIKLIWLAWQAW
jgi:mannose-6-phosphate isomerase-like protein (cupin superfamily)